MLELGGIQLPDLWFDPMGRFGFTGVDARFAVSRGGNAIIWEQASGYKEADLVGGADTAWIDHATLVLLLGLASMPGAEYILSYEGTDYQVRFRNWEPPVISADPIHPRPNADNTDYYRNVRIRLIIVG